MEEIKVIDRENGELFTEKIYGEAALKFIYTNPVGKIISKAVALTPFSQFYGKMQDHWASRMKVPKFVQNYDIDMNQFEPGSLESNPIEQSYKNFNEFFIRKFKPGQRNYVQGNEFPAPAEARYVAFNEINQDVKYPVKGKHLSAKALLNSEKWGDVFEGGPLVIARLCPVDYHRYHYPDNGKCIDAYNVNGFLYSVNPFALKFNGEIFIQNERRVSILETENFGKLAYIEVGATCVGKIVQSFDESKPFKRGDEKGYFLFGGSTVVLMGEPGKWLPAKDIVENTSKGIETYLKIGSAMGSKI